MSANVCPSCNRPLAAAVINGPTQAVVRCEGCQTLLLWSNGRVMRSAKSTTGTMMGMPAVQVPAAGVTRPAVPPREREAPLPELRPEADATAALPKTPAPRSAPPKTPPPRSGTQPLMGRVPTAKQSVTGLGDNIPTKVAEPSAELRKESARKDPTPSPMKVPPSGPMKVSPNAPATVRKDPTPPPMKVPPSGPLKVPPSAPMKVSPSGPNKIGAPPPAAKAEPPSADAAKGEAPHVVAAVAQVPKMSDGGELVDPSAWFAGDVSEVVAPESVPPLPAPPAPPVIESTRPARADTTGAQPLPPPPSLSAVESAPFEIEAPGNEPTPALGTLMPEARAQDSAPIAVGRDPSQKIPLREPSPRVETGKKPASSIRGADPLVPPPSSTAAEPTDLPRARTTIGKPPEAPLRSTMLGRPAAELPRAPEAPAARPTPAATATPAAPRTPPRGEPVAAAVSMLPPPAAAAPRPSDATPVKGHAAFNAPAATVEREVSAEALPPPPTASPADTTAQTTLPAQPETRRVPLQVSRRLLFIVGGVTAGVIVLVFMVVAMSRGPKRPAPSPSPIAITKPAPTPPAPTPPAPTPPAPAPSPPVAAAPKPATPPPTEVAPPPAPPPTEEPVAPPPPPPRPRHTLGGKKVVLEYDPKPTSPTPPAPQAVTPMGEDPATVARARETYHRGNVKLFAGDSAGAIALYRESLKIYPGYVAGYRGLGLGYEAAGDLGEALKAFHTYVRTVPSANDTPIIRRRIDRLESQKSGGAPH